MERLSSEKLYTEIDLDKAYVNGLECAIVVLEKAINQSYTVQKLMIESLKKIVLENKIKAVTGR